MLSIQNITILSTNNQLTVSVKVESVKNLSENLRLLTFNLKGTNWKSLLPEEAVLEFPIDPAASKYYFERTFAILSGLYTNCFLEPKIWFSIEPQLRTINFIQLASSNTELNLYTAPIVTEIDKHEEITKTVKETHSSLEINLDDELGMHTQVKVTGATSGSVKINIETGSKSVFFKGLQGDNITVTDATHSIDWTKLSNFTSK